MAIEAANGVQTRPLSDAWLVLTVPLIFAVLGLLIRYAAYVTATPDATLGGYLPAVCGWDCDWYVAISETGYNPFPNVPALIEHGNWAFFPLYPVMVGLLRHVVNISTIELASISSVLLSCFSAILAWPLLGRDRRAYVLFSAFLLCGPFSFYFSTFLSESLYFFLTVAVFVMLKRSNYLAAGFFAALLSATRVVGVFIVLAIVVQAFLDHRAKGGDFRSFLSSAWRDGDLMLAVFLAPLGLFCYMAFLHFYIGDALAFQHVQRAWAREPDNPFFYLFCGLMSFAEPGSDALVTPGQYLGLAVLVGLGLAGVLAWRRQYAEALFSVICLGLPLFTGLASMIRFTAALAPVIVLLSRLLAKHRWLFAMSLLLMLLLDYGITIYWFGGHIALT